MSKEKKERGIEETLRELEIDPDLTPEEAAQHEGALAAIELEDEELPTLSPKDQAPGVPVRGGENDDDDDGVVPLPSAERPPHMPPALIPLPSMRGRPKTKERPGVRGFSKSLADRVPGADKVKVYKRLDGRRWFIADYTRSDLALFPDFESFLTRYVKAEHGPGEYDLVGVDGLNRESELGQVRLIASPQKQQNAESNAIGLVEKVLAEQKERDEKWMMRMLGQQQSPLDLLNGVMTLKKEIEGESSKTMPDMLKAVGESSSQTIQMMMMMMQQQQQAADRQNQLMMSVLMKPKDEDPMMKILLAKFLDNHDSGVSAPPPLPPGGPPKPMEGVVELITAISTVMTTLGGNSGGDDEYKELVKTLLLQKLEGGKDGDSSFKSAIDNMAAIMNVAQNFNRSNEGGAAAGFFDALAALFSNRDFAGSIAQTIRAKTSQTSEQERLSAERQRVDLEKRLLERKRRELLDASPQVQQQPPRPTPQVTTEEVQQAAERVVERTGKIPQLPANTHEHINAIMLAKDEAEKVGKTIEMLVYFAEFPDWRNFSEQLLGFVRAGRKAEAMQYLAAFFEGLTAIGLVETEAGKHIVRLLHKHFVTVQEQLSDIPLEADKEITGDALLAAAEGAAQ